MRQLRYVGAVPDASPTDASADGDPAELLLVEDEDTGEQFALRLDDALRAAAAPPASAPPASAPAASAPAAAAADAPPAGGPTLTPREIQLRVRAGESPEALAQQTGAPTERIARFAYAVLQERLRVGAEARRARARRGGADGELLPFGEVVDARFEEHGISAATVTWDAVREGDGPWTVIARWASGDGAQSSARWSFLLGPRTVVPEDDTAMELLSDRPVQRHRGAPVAIAAVPAPAEDDADAGGGAANLRRLPPRADDQFFDQDAPAEPPAPSFGGLRAVPVAPPAPPVAASPPPAAAPKPPAAPPAPALGSFFDDGAQSGEPTLPFETLEARPAPERTLVEAEDLIETQELAPSPPPAAATPAAPAADDSEDDRAGRARIPSWDDILLGVRRKRD